MHIQGAAPFMHMAKKMEIVINKTELNNAIKKVSKAISPTVVIPALSGILLHVGKDVTLTGSDTDLTVQAKLDQESVEVIDQGSVIFPAKEFSRIVQLLPESDISIKMQDKLQVVLESGKAKYTLNVMDGNEYPRLPKAKGVDFSVKGDVLKSLIEKTIYSVSSSETRPVLTGVNFSFTGDQMVLVATDSHRLSRLVHSSPSASSSKNITVPGKVLKEIPAIMGKDEEVKISINDHNIVFQTEYIKIYSRLLDGKYPETDRLIPSDYKTKLTVDRNSFLSAMERASVLQDKNRSVVTLKHENDGNSMFHTVELSQRNTELGKSEETVIVDKIEGENITLSFNPFYVMEALKVIESEKVIIEFTDAMRPFVIKPDDNTDYLSLILPVRTY